MITDFQINAFRDNSQENVDIAALPGGGFVAVWQSSGQDGGNNGFDGFTGAYGRVFDNAGNPLTDEFQIPENNAQTQFSPEVEVLRDGSFVVAWESEGPDSNGSTDDFHVYTQRFALTGGTVVRVGAETQVSTDARDEDQRFQDLTLTADGGYRVTWVSSLVRTDWTVLTRGYDANGAAIEGERVIGVDVRTRGPFPFQTVTPGFQLLATADGGYWAVNWEATLPTDVGEAVFLQRYDAAGNLVGPLRLVSAPGDPADNVNPRITGLATGGFAVNWSGATEGQGRDAFVRTFDAGGNAITGPVRINDVTEAGQAPGEIVALADGGFLATYVSYVRTENGADLAETLGRRFNAAGEPVSGSIDLSQYVYADMSAPTAQLLADGSIVFGWDDARSLKGDVFGSILSAAAIPIAPINGTPGADVLTGTAADDYFRPGAGSDVVNGGGGRDTVLYDGGAYGVMRRGAEVLAGAADRSELDRLTDVERLAFPGRTVDVARLPSITPWEYLAGNADLLAAFGGDVGAAEAHRLNWGVYEGRGGFDGLSYSASHADLAAAFGTDADAAARHYVGFGRAEGRAVSFDPLAYGATYADLRAAFGADAESLAAHYLVSGRAEGRTVGFDPLGYTAAYGDLIGAYGLNGQAAATHYIDFGAAEGRSDRFDAAQYLSNYADLRAAFGADGAAATRHFISFGYNEGRTDAPIAGAEATFTG